MKAKKRQASAYLRFLQGLPRGYIFSSRDLIAFAPRTTIDCALSRMVKSGMLQRLARGIFRFFDPRNRPVSAQRLAAVKRKAFGRKIATVANIVARPAIKRLEDTGIEKLKPSGFVVVTDGRTSSFLNHQNLMRINCKSVAMRMKGLGETLAGRVLRDLWLLGQVSVTTEVVANVWSYLPTRETAKVPALKKLLPDWLVRILPATPKNVLEDLMIRPVKKAVRLKPLVKPEPDSAKTEVEDREDLLRQADELNQWLDEIDRDDLEFP